MKIRAIAFALPLVMGIAACKTSSSQGSTASGSTTASTEGQGNAGQPQADQQSRGAAGPTAAGEASAANKGEASGTEAATPGMGASGSATGTADPSTGSATASGDVYGGASPGTSGTATGTMSGDTGASASGSTASSDDVKGHADDQVVKGKISKVSSKSVTITTDAGSDKMLDVAPETTIQVDGQDARSSDLQEGQPVRASYSNTEGRDVAVEIHVGEDPSGSSGSLQEPSSGSMGTTGSDPGTGSTDSKSSTSTGSDRKY